ncbi:MAG: hypothetical protein HN348_25490, partial [Proteobacteria bacterium]|nr:hypothetical protein [Pseudomonadota bacterium]
LVACSEKEPPGHYWDVTALGIVDECNDPTFAFQETFKYRLVFDGNDVVLAIGEDILASGTIAGCDINYESIIWEETRDEEITVRWQLTGAASVFTGGDSCKMDDTDWRGTETFEIVYSEDPDIAQGCEYEMELDGVYIGEVT